MGLPRIREQQQRPSGSSTQRGRSSLGSSSSGNPREEAEFSDATSEPDLSSSEEYHDLPERYDLDNRHEHYHLDSQDSLEEGLEALCQEGRCRKRETLGDCRKRSRKWAEELDEDLDPRLMDHRAYRCQKGLVTPSTKAARGGLAAAANAVSLLRSRGVATPAPLAEEQKRRRIEKQNRLLAEEQRRRLRQEFLERQQHQRETRAYQRLAFTDGHPDSTDWSLLPAAFLLARRVVPVGLR